MGLVVWKLIKGAEQFGKSFSQGGTCVSEGNDVPKIFEKRRQRIFIVLLNGDIAHSTSTQSDICPAAGVDAIRLY